MDCTRNAFCKTLPPESRKKLCASCRKRFFKAGSIQLRDDFPHSGMLLLDGIVVSTTNLGEDVVNHETDVPALYLGFPGHIVGFEIVFGFKNLNGAFEYLDLEYLTDSWVATFSHEAILELYEKDLAFRHSIGMGLLQLATDALQCVALFRANYTYLGLYHLLKMLAFHGQFLTQQQLAAILNHDRTSISKAISRIKKEYPEVWEAYAQNKNRVLSRPVPRDEE